MRLRYRITLRTLICCMFLSLAALTASLSRAPAQQGGKGQEHLPYTEESSFRSKYGDLKSMFQGDMPPDKKLLDLAARHYSYRLTHTNLQDKKDMMHKLVSEANSEVDANRKEERKGTEAVQQFNTLLVAHLKEVLPNPRPIASINAAMILAHMAAVGQEEATDPLIDALNDKDMNPGTKYEAIKGLGSFFQLAFPTGDEQPITFSNKAREAKAIQALVAAVDIKPPQSPPPTPEEIEGIRAFRREAIHALGFCRYPAVADDKGEIQSRPAQTLVRVLRNSDLNPPSRLDEQVEAAIGLAQLKVVPRKDYKINNQYQLDVATYHLGRFMVDFARRHQDRGEEKKTAHAQPWKTFGARMYVALDGLKNEARILNRNDPKKYGEIVKYVTQILDLSQNQVLKAVESDGSTAPDKLSEVLESKPLDGEPIYKGDSSSVVKPGSAALTTEDAPAKEKTKDEDKKEKAKDEDKKAKPKDEKKK